MENTLYVLLLCLISGLFSSWCSGLKRHQMDDLESDMHSEDVLENLLGVLDLDGQIPKHGSFPTPPPKYMLELYRQYSGSDRNENLKYKTANIVRSFSNKDESADNGHYFFDLTDAISKSEEIIGAEFRFFIGKNIMGWQQTSDVIKVQLYEGQENEASSFLNESTISGSDTDFEVFSIKSLVEKWLENSNLNEGITINVVDSSGHKLPNEIMQKDNDSVLIIFSRNFKMTKSITSIQNSSPPDSNSVEASREKEYDSKHENNRGTRSVPEPKKEPLCKRYDLRIYFGEIGWYPWIIEPKWYNAYACRGACVFGKNQNTTTHARMQSLVHHLKLSSSMGTPCCVPTELQPLSILFYDKNSNSVLAKFDDMVATDCGCR